MNMGIAEYLNHPYLKSLYNNTLSKKNSIGVDGINRQAFAEDIDKNIDVIIRKITNNSYVFSLYREKLIIKDRKSHPRMLSIPTNRDKLVLKMIDKFLRKSYSDVAFSKTIHSNISDIIKNIESGKHNAYIKIDVKNFYPTIDHDILYAILQQDISDNVVLPLIMNAIKQSTVSNDEEDRSKFTNNIGVPQGLSISSILSSIYLSSIDKKLSERDDLCFYRFVDDILILCNFDDIADISKEIDSQMKNIGLSIHSLSEEKSKSSSGRIDEEFQFLGYLFSGNKISVRKSSLDKIYKGINRIFLKYYSQIDVENDDHIDYLYFRINLKITGCSYGDKQYGWLHYFSLINDQTLLFKLDAYVKRCFKQYGMPYDKEKIKKFSRTYYELKKIRQSSYVPRIPLPWHLTVLKDETQNDKNNVNAKNDGEQVVSDKMPASSIQAQPKLQKNQEFTEIISDIEQDIEIY